MGGGEGREAGEKKKWLVLTWLLSPVKLASWLPCDGGGWGWGALCLKECPGPGSPPVPWGWAVAHGVAEIRLRPYTLLGCKNLSDVESFIADEELEKGA